MILYGIPNCNTVKKAQVWLKAQKIDFEFHDFKKKGVSAYLLKKWFSAFGWQKVLNRAGLTFKKLSLEQKAEICAEEKAIAYLLKNPGAIKRPILERNGKPVLMGFDEKEYQDKIKVAV